MWTFFSCRNKNELKGFALHFPNFCEKIAIPSKTEPRIFHNLLIFNKKKFFKKCTSYY